MNNGLVRALLTSISRRPAALDFLACVRRFRPDLILLLKTDDLPRGTIAKARAEAPRCLVFAFHTDDPFNTDRIRGPSHPRVFSQIRSVDHYFIWSDRIAEQLRRKTKAPVSYLGFACDPEFTRPLETGEADRAHFGADVSFVGNWDPKREAWLAPIAHSSDVSLAIWGEPYWANRVRDRRVAACWRGRATGDDFARAVLASRVSINILRPQNETAENMRSYEIPACAGAMLAEWSAQQDRVFRRDVEALYVTSPAQLLHRVRSVARSPRDLLETLKAAALRRAREHTYRSRAQTIIEEATNHATIR